MHVHSDLWLDQPDAHDRIVARLAADALTADEAEKLHGFVDNGYITTPLGLDEAFCDALDDEIGALWQRRPADLAVSPHIGRPMSFADYEGPVRERGYRIPDLHGYSPLALSLYLHPALFRLVELIFDEPALAFQSLYFEHGSTQGLHRDPMFVATRPTSNLCAAWIALEDITAGQRAARVRSRLASSALVRIRAGDGRVQTERRARAARRVRVVGAGDDAGEGSRASGVHLQARRRVHLARRPRARRRDHRESGTDAQELRGALHDRGRLHSRERRAWRCATGPGGAGLRARPRRSSNVTGRVVSTHRFGSPPRARNHGPELPSRHWRLRGASGHGARVPDPGEEPPQLVVIDPGIAARVSRAARGSSACARARFAMMHVANDGRRGSCWHRH